MNILDLHEKVKNDRFVEVHIGEIDNEDFIIKVKKYLTLTEFASFVLEMSDAEFDNGDKTFAPDVGVIAFKLLLVKKYTDLELPDDLELAFQIINEFEIDAKILNIIQDTVQYSDLLQIVERRLDYKRDSMIGINKLYTALAEGINSIPWAKIGDFAGEYLDPNNMDKLVKLLSDLYDAGKFDSIIEALIK